MATKKKAGRRVSVSTVQGHNELSRAWVRKEVGEDFQHITETDDWRWWNGHWAAGRAPGDADHLQAGRDGVAQPQGTASPIR